MKYLPEHPNLEQVIIFYIYDNPGISYHQLKERVKTKLPDILDVLFSNALWRLNQQKEITEFVVINDYTSFHYYPKGTIIKQCSQ